MSRINTPVNQKRLTNIAVVRLKKCGVRFEVACYPNKVQEWKKKIESDLDEVLQSFKVFSNVSKGVIAKDKDLVRAFGTTDHAKVCLEILKVGELQVSQKEREDQLRKTYRDIATIISEKCINKQTKKGLTVGMIESALLDIKFKINPSKSARQQVSQAIKALQEETSLPIERSKIRVALELRSEEMKQRLNESTIAKEWTLESEGNGVLQAWIDPAHYSTLLEMAKEDGGRVSVLEMQDDFDSG
ncbi:ribosome maturation protein SBDS-like isoform X1 [Schistocerca gregaria]|uniref:ribosome maturation protein SBDS-like isoform X1 n=1 Tax=Schistocerca gregaria TaxID=7010 RepID=UPI00211ED807|nr:ribosome maturation protein SBDS-like isoform X1 [Schistocerca gregaria]